MRLFLRYLILLTAVAAAPAITPWQQLASGAIPPRINKAKDNVNVPGVKTIVTPPNFLIRGNRILLQLPDGCTATLVPPDLVNGGTNDPIHARTYWNKYGLDYRLTLKSHGKTIQASMSLSLYPTPSSPGYKPSAGAKHLRSVDGYPVALEYPGLNDDYVTFTTVPSRPLKVNVIAEFDAIDSATAQALHPFVIAIARHIREVN